jgi:hypothetical protein
MLTIKIDKIIILPVRLTLEQTRTLLPRWDSSRTRVRCIFTMIHKNRSDRSDSFATRHDPRAGVSG